MRTEYDTLVKNNTWELTDRPANKKILTNKWVFKLKKNQDGSVDKHKARLVARGHEQRAGIDYEEVFAPVARYETIRTLLAVSVQKKLHVHQMDVVAAYVQGDLQEEVYMEQPEMFEMKNERDKVCRLKKPLYGLKQAGRAWYTKLDKHLSKVGLKKSNIDPCVYVLGNSPQDRVIVIIYVDDLLIAASSLKNLQSVKDKLMKNFKMKDLGPISNILGINVTRKGPTGSIKLTQTKYIQSLLNRFNMIECKSVATPMEISTVLTKQSSPQTNEERIQMQNVPYRELIGALIYLSNATRPDIAFVASALSRFCTNPGPTHWKLAKRVLRYLQGTLNCGIIYTESNNDKLKAYVDSDWAGDIDDRRSCSGYVFMLANGPIAWEAKKQRSVALSTMEAEYMALSEVAKESIYMRRLIKHMGYTDLVNDATIVHCDNQSAIQLSKNCVFHGKSKHIAIRYHFSREASDNGEIKIIYLKSEQMKADILTKALSKDKHIHCMDLLNLS